MTDDPPVWVAALAMTEKTAGSANDDRPPAGLASAVKYEAKGKIPRYWATHGFGMSGVGSHGTSWSRIRVGPPG